MFKYTVTCCKLQKDPSTVTSITQINDTREQVCILALLTTVGKTDCEAKALIRAITHLVSTFGHI